METHQEREEVRQSTPGGRFAVVVIIGMPSPARSRELVRRDVVTAIEVGAKESVVYRKVRRGKRKGGDPYVARAILLLLRRASMTASTYGTLKSSDELACRGDALAAGLRTSSRDSTLAVWPTKTWRAG